MNAECVQFTLEFERLISGHLFDFCGKRNDERKGRADHVNNEGGASEGGTFSINFASDVNTTGNPPDLACTNACYTARVIELLFDQIPAVEIFKIGQWGRVRGINIRTSFEAVDA